jgi:hypothetical protein
MFYVIHSTVSFGRTITLAPSLEFVVWADTEDQAIARARILGWADMLGFKFQGVQRAGQPALV